ncbi:MAG: hypothetical protein K8I00_07715 [Candidatus Omnitrophica bacterium]|nr:hypothetical protein [Candidatus Omnitrophota bacterium]
MTLRLLLFIGFLLTTAAAWGADEARPVAIFNNTRIYESDLQLSPQLAASKQATLSAIKFRQFEYTYRMEILALKIHSLLMNRILAEIGYQVTDDEVEAYLQHVRKLKSSVTPADLVHIRTKIMRWHFDSYLYDKYGGRTIRLPDGRVKPVEAYYRLVNDMMEQQVLFFPNMSYRAALTVLEAYFERDNHPEATELQCSIYLLQPTWGPYNKRYNDLPPKEKYRIKTRMKMLRRLE